MCFNCLITQWYTGLPKIIAAKQQPSHTGRLCSYSVLCFYLNVYYLHIYTAQNYSTVQSLDHLQISTTTPRLYNMYKYIQTPTNNERVHCFQLNCIKSPLFMSIDFNSNMGVCKSTLLTSFNSAVEVKHLLRVIIYSFLCSIS